MSTSKLRTRHQALWTTIIDVYNSISLKRSSLLGNTKFFSLPFLDSYVLYDRHHPVLYLLLPQWPFHFSNQNNIPSIYQDEKFKAPGATQSDNTSSETIGRLYQDLCPIRTRLLFWTPWIVILCQVFSNIYIWGTLQTFRLISQSFVGKYTIKS